MPTIQDRALQGAVSEILSQIYEVDFVSQSFGGRPKLSAYHAVINLQNQVTVKWKVLVLFETQQVVYLVEVDDGGGNFHVPVGPFR